MEKLVCILFLLFCWAGALRSQDLTGQWSGELTQEGKPGGFVYTLALSQQGGEVSGTATSRSADGSNAARFEVGGLFDGQHLTLQEVEQLEPKGAQWCLKHIRLQYAEKGTSATLSGEWEAEGCKPGKLRLSRSAAETGGESPAPPTGMAGKWTGHLAQSDRDYGFYFDLELAADGTGRSHIISDGEGGNATHQLRWSMDEAAGRVDFEETDLVEESVPEWRWCMKSGSLFLKKEENRRSLAGRWDGYIEGFSRNTGPCAPGTLYVERPVFKKEELTNPGPQQAGGQTRAPKPIGVADYEKKLNRDVEVERVLEVKSRTLRIRVWDNGTVDGDVCTLFLNGEMVLKNYRVTRQKNETIVTLEKPVNYLILHAINLGSITPNTIAVSVDDGVQEQVVIVSSNLATSGAVMIREFTVDKD